MAKKLMRPRWLARLRAFFTGYFWRKCETCGRHFGGFESGGPSAYAGDGLFMIGCCECTPLQYHYEYKDGWPGHMVVVDAPGRPKEEQP